MSTSLGTGPAGSAQAGLVRAHRDSWGRAVATLTAWCGDLDLAEESVAEAFAMAAARWPVDGVPPNAGGWIVTTGRRKALDRIRREADRPHRYAAADLLHPPTTPTAPGDDDPEGGFVDDRLRLLFTCCHPALAMPARVALTLRMLGGLETPTIARAFLVEEATMAQRLVRAKRKIADARIPYRVPEPGELPERLGGVLAVLYLVFTAGHRSDSGPDLGRDDLAGEAVRLTRVLAGLQPDEPEVRGLLALMLLAHARRDARVDADGRLVLLAEQDRSRWHAAEVAEGLDLVRGCLALGRPGLYQVQAALQAVHADAPVGGLTDWSNILDLYDLLLTLAPTPVVRLNRAVAVAEVHGPQQALAEVDALDLASYRPLHVVRAELLTRLDRPEQARAAFDAALALPGSAVEDEHLRRRREQD